MSVGTEHFRATQQESDEDGPGAIVVFPLDRMTVERFRMAFPRARWRETIRAWFVPGATAERRLDAWSGREWTGVLAHADERGRDAFAFDPLSSPYLEAGEDLVVRTPYSRDVVSELRLVPWARWDAPTKAWHVPFRSFEDLRRRWPSIEAAARLAEPEERKRRAAERKAAPDHSDRLAEAAERRRNRYPVPEDALPPLGRVLMTHAGVAVFEDVTGEVAEPPLAGRFYPGVDAGRATLVWAQRRRPTLDELIQAWPARAGPFPDEIARGWWQPTIETLRDERRKAASLARAAETRRAKPS